MIVVIAHDVEVKEPISNTSNETLLCTGLFLYLLYSFLLISNKFCNGGSSAVMLLNRTGGVVWALKPPKLPLNTLVKSPVGSRT
jgi:hypothetical protein